MTKRRTTPPADDAHQPPGLPGWSISRAAAELGRDRRTIADAVRNLRPVGFHHGAKVYRLGDIAVALAGRDVGGMDIAEARRRRMVAEARLAEIDLAEAEKRSAPIGEIAEDVGREYASLRAQLLVIAPKTAPLLATEGAIAACHRIVFDAIVAALTELTMDAKTAASAEKLGRAANGSKKGDDDA